MKHFLIIIPILVLSNLINAQKNVTTFGIQIKPLVSNKFFDNGEFFAVADSFSVSLNPRLGMNFGMLMRKGFTNALSVEAGINMVRRNFTLSATDTIHDLSIDTRFAYVGYEIPVQGLLYVKLGKKLFMNMAGGVSFDFYPSSAFSQNASKQDTLNYDVVQTSIRNVWGQVSVIANLGFEYRTKESGYFYLGASLHRSFGYIAETEVIYTVNRRSDSIKLPLSGNYFTFDVRYFFYEPEERRVKR